MHQHVNIIPCCFTYTIAIGQVHFQGGVHYTAHNVKHHQSFAKYEKDPSIDIYCTGLVDWTSGFDWWTGANLCKILLTVETDSPTSFPCRNVITFFLFFIRAFATGVFQAVYVYTPEVYPTSVRGTAMGYCSAAARLGAIVTPFFAQVFTQSSTKPTQWEHHYK